MSDELPVDRLLDAFQGLDAWIHRPDDRLLAIVDGLDGPDEPDELDEPRPSARERLAASLDGVVYRRVMRELALTA